MIQILLSTLIIKSSNFGHTLKLYTLYIVVFLVTDAGQNDIYLPADGREGWRYVDSISHRWLRKT